MVSKIRTPFWIAGFMCVYTCRHCVYAPNASVQMVYKTGDHADAFWPLPTEAGPFAGQSEASPLEEKTTFGPALLVGQTSSNMAQVG